MPAKVKKGVKRSSREKLVSKAIQSDKQQTVKALRDVSALGRRLEKLFRTEGTAFGSLLKQHRGYAPFEVKLKSLNSSIREKLAAVEGKPKKLERATRSHTRDVRKLMEADKTLFARAYRQAIDDTQLNTKLLSLLANGEGFVLKRSKFGTATMRSFHHLDDDHTINPVGREPDVPLSPCLEAPFDDGGFHTEDTLASVTTAGFNETGGSSFSSALALEAGGAAARAAVGSFVTVPSGYNKLTLSAQMRCDFKVEAYSVAAVSYAAVDTMVELFDVAGNTRIDATENVSRVLAPVGWSVVNETVDTFFINATFLIPATGGEFLVRAGGRASVWAGGYFAMAGANIRTFRTEICVEASI